MSFIKLKEGRYIDVASPAGKKLVKEVAAKAKLETAARDKAAKEKADNLKAARVAELQELLKEAKK